MVLNPEESLERLGSLQIKLFFSFFEETDQVLFSVFSVKQPQDLAWLMRAPSTLLQLASFIVQDCILDKDKSLRLKYALFSIFFELGRARSN